MRRVLGILTVFCLLPLAGALVYVHEAVPTYRSSTSFVVRSAEGLGGSSVPSVLRSVLSSAGSEVGAVVREYLLSPAFIRSLDEQFALRRHYGVGDLLGRFPRPWEDGTQERFHGYFLGRFMVALEPQSNVLTVTLDTFDPALGQAVLSHLVRAVQERVDQFNEQMRHDTLGLAQQELARARMRLEKAGAALASYRQLHRILDPERQAMLDLQVRQEAEAKLTIAQARLDHAQQVAPSAPSTLALRAEVAALRASLEALQTRAVGEEDNARVAHADQFSRLALEWQTASKIVMAAEEAVVRSRADAERRHLYVEVLSPPSLPDDIHSPRLVRTMLATVLVGSLLGGVGWLLGIGAREHTADRA